jgi:response regulator NasT
MPALERQPLRVLVVNEAHERLDELASVVAALGQEVVAHGIDVTGVRDIARQVGPDVAIVGLHDHHTTHALEMIGELVREGTCPVIALIDGEDPDFIEQAASRGIFAYTSSLEPAALRSAIDVSLGRFGQSRQLEGALGRRALIERAKGVLMERHSLDEDDAFDMLRDHARRSGRKVVDVAESLLSSHALTRPRTS